MGGGRQRPAVVVDDRTGPDGNIAPIDTTAQLVDHPKTLSILWREWMLGLDETNQQLISLHKKGTTTKTRTNTSKESRFGYC